VALAADAKNTLGIPAEVGPFAVSKEALKADFPSPSAPSPSNLPAGTPAAPAANAGRRPTKKF
jgi:hypothetical protein